MILIVAPLRCETKDRRDDMLFRMNREYFCECCEFYKTFEEMHGDNDTICAVCQEGQEEWEYINSNEEGDD